MAKLEKEKADLEKRIAFLQTDQGREEEIRNKFMVAKEGEEVIIVVDPKPATTTKSVLKKTGFWETLFNFFR